MNEKTHFKLENGLVTTRYRHFVSHGHDRLQKLIIGEGDLKSRLLSECLLMKIDLVSAMFYDKEYEERKESLLEKLTKEFVRDNEYSELKKLVEEFQFLHFMASELEGQ